jgi:hypothetical protein
MKEKRESIKRGADSDPQAKWLALLDEQKKRRESLIRRLRRAERAGDQRKAGDLLRQLRNLYPLASCTREEWDKAIPQKLRNHKGREAWDTLFLYRNASEDEQAEVAEKLRPLADRRKSNDAAMALWMILRNLPLDGEFFSKLAIAFKEEQSSESHKVKEDLLRYRISVMSLTPGNTRPITEIQQIVDPHKRIPLQTFGNWVRNFKVPHLDDKSKRGKASPNYGKGRR